jgi:uncharacterized membrane protein
MSTMMPFSKKWGPLSGMAFCLTAILGYDLVTGTLGTWSVITAGTYAVLGVFAGLYLKNKSNKIKYYLAFSIVATLIYDAVTGIGMGMLLFNQSFTSTFVGQIPFTLYHLAGNIALSCVVSPLLFRWVLLNPRLEMQQVLTKISSVYTRS